MWSKAVLKTGAAFFCGTVFGLVVYSFSTQGNQVFQYVTTMPKFGASRDLDSKQILRQSSLSRHPLDKTSPRNGFRPHDDLSPSDTTSPQTHVNENVFEKVAKTKTSSAVMVLILAYMRTGSTLTADVIQQHKDTFYVFEPLINIWHKKVATYMNGRKRKFALKEEQVEESLRQLKAWYTCDFKQADLQFFKHAFMGMGIKTMPTRTCLQRHKNNFNQTVYEQCIAPLVERCRNSTVRVIKTIRMSATDIEDLLKNFPSLKVIHLVRDPRGITVSRIKMRVQGTDQSSVLNSSFGICDRITKDGKNIVYLQSLFPGRFKRIRYEEFTYYPIETVKRIYEFIGLTPTKEILKYVLSITSSSKNIEKPYNTERKNSVFTANAWRLRVMKNVTDLIDEACDDMYKMYGYLKPKSLKELKDINKTRLWVEDLNN